jgi:hypothetical protein
MKALTTLMIGLFISFILSELSISQERFRSGSYSVGGGLGFAAENFENENYLNQFWNIEIKPNISYFIFNYISGDVFLRFGYDEQQDKYKYDWGWETIDTKIKSSNVSIGLGLSFYLPLKDTYPFFKISYSYGHTFQNTLGKDERVLSASVGLAVFLTNSVALEPEIGYDYGQWSYSKDKRNIYRFSFGIKYYVYEFGLE